MTASDRPWTTSEVRALGLHTTVETAASVLGVSRSAAYDAIRRGEFPALTFRVGRRIRVSVQSLLDLMGAS